MTGTKTFAFLAALLATPLSAQITNYGGPSYGYNAQQQLIVFDMIGVGPAVRGGTLQWVTADHQASSVFFAVGLAPAVILHPFGTTQLVGSVLNTYVATFIPGAGGAWEVSWQIPNTQAVVGLHTYAQFAHVYPSHFAVTDAVLAVIQ